MATGMRLFFWWIFSMKQKTTFETYFSLTFLHQEMRFFRASPEVYCSDRYYSLIWSWNSRTVCCPDVPRTDPSNNSCFNKCRQCFELDDPKMKVISQILVSVQYASRDGSNADVTLNLYRPMCVYKLIVLIVVLVISVRLCIIVVYLFIGITILLPFSIKTARIINNNIKYDLFYTISTEVRLLI